MPLAPVIAALVAALVGGLLGWWPLAAWASRSMKHERMSHRAVRVSSAAITAVTFALITLRFGLSWLLPALLVFAAAATVLTVVDLAEKRLPNAVVFPTLAAVVVLLVPPTWALGEWMLLVWAVVGAAAMFAVYFILALISPSSMGMGDVKLALVIGLLLGLVRTQRLAHRVAGRVRRRGSDRACRARVAEGDPARVDSVRPVDARGCLDRGVARRLTVGRVGAKRRIETRCGRA